jgi:hypothetical protein
MKPNLGRMVFLWLLGTALAWGVTYKWSIEKFPTSLHVHQSGVIRYVCVYDGSAVEYSIKLQFVENNRYQASMLFEQDKVVNKKRVQTFDVVITPKVAGTLDVNLNAIVSVTSLAAIENTVLGRDNVGKDDVVETVVSLPAVKIRADENSVALVGDMTLQANVDSIRVREHEPLHLSLFVRGSGNLDQFVPYELNISGVKVFAQPPIKSISLSKDGYEGEIRQEFALVAEKSFTIPSLDLSVFDVVSQKAKVLQTKPIAITIDEGYEPLNLLDAPAINEGHELKKYSFYTFLVVLGIVLGEVGKWLWKRRPKREAKQFWESASSVKELILLLSLRGDKKYDFVVRDLETGTMSLREAKKKLDKLTADKKVK